MDDLFTQIVCEWVKRTYSDPSQRLKLLAISALQNSQNDPCDIVKQMRINGTFAHVLARSTVVDLFPDMFEAWERACKIQGMA